MDGVVDAKYQLLQLGLKITICKAQAAVVKKVDHSIHWINLYPVDNAIGFPQDKRLSTRYLTYPQDKRCIVYA